MRQFETGATRDEDIDKLDYEGFLSPIVIERFAQYMQKHQKQVDGQLRTSDNWQKGIAKEVYMKSMWRHFMDVWKEHRKVNNIAIDREEALCALLFNIMGYLFEELTKREIKEDEQLEYWGC